MIAFLTIPFYGKNGTFVGDFQTKSCFLLNCSMINVSKKQLFGGINKDVETKHLAETDVLNRKNMRVGKGDSGKESSNHLVKGNVLKTYTYPAGTNRVIGSYEDVQHNWLIYFVYNSNNDDSILKYDVDTGTVSKIIEGDLGFTGKNDHVTSVGVVDDLLMWSDGTNEIRCINITKAINGDYDLSKENQFTLVKTPPLEVLSLSRGSDPSVPFNNIANHSFKFACRYVWVDNEVSILSMHSEVSLGAEVAQENILDTSNNKIDVTVDVSGDYYDFIKRVEFFYKKDDSTTWYYFDKLESPASGTGGGSNTVTFYNSNQGFALSDVEATKTSEAIPSKSTAMASFKNRVFATRDEIGLDLSGDTTSGSVTFATGVTHKANGKYPYGIKFFDEFGRSSNVKPLGEINVGGGTYDTNGVTTGSLQTPQITLSGSPPSWATKYQLCVKKEQTYAKYMQCQANFFFATFRAIDGSGVEYPDTTGSDGGTGGTSIAYEGYFYARDVSSMNIDFALHIKLSSNAPFVPEKGMYVRILHVSSGTTFTTVERITDITPVNGMLVVGMFGKTYTEWQSITANGLVEVFSLQEAPDPLYYETGQSYNITGGNYSTNPVTPNGDTYKMTYNSYLDNLYDRPSGEGVRDANMHHEFTHALISGSGQTFSWRSLNAESPSRVFELVEGAVYGGGDFAIERKQIDYSKSINSYGRGFPENPDESDINQEETIAFSHPYVQDSNINGLSSFDSLNRHALPVDRTKIKKLVPAVAEFSEVLLAVHERNLSTMYVGEGLIRQGSDNILAKTDSVIADDRLLAGGFGTVHPSSVVSNKGRVYGFDVYKGVPWRYSNNGATDISGKMYSWFQNVAKMIQADIANWTVVGGYDPYYELFILTFSNEGTSYFKTIAFNEDSKVWEQEYDFFPSYYGKIGDEMISFKLDDAACYLHNSDSASVNTFYGTQYSGVVETVINEAPDKVKLWNFISIEADAKPSIVRLSNPEGQSTSLDDQDFEEIDGVYYATIKGDTNTTDLEAGQSGYLNGELMRSQTLEVEITFGTITGQHKLTSVTVGYTPVSGHFV